MFKIRSVDDRINLAHMEPRAQDVIDVVSILRAFKISDLDDVGIELIRNTIPYFPNAVNYLIENGMVRGTKLKKKETQGVKFEDTEYGKRVLDQIQDSNPARTS
ncbi:MAG: hypothetical protein K5678_00805 [Acetatifactor sp.]|nr:hypothetical protein [Acetatifactor sp.]